MNKIVTAIAAKSVVRLERKVPTALQAAITSRSADAMTGQRKKVMSECLKK